MNERRPTSIAQPGMTAWGRAAERDLEGYRRRTAFASPIDFTDRVMAAIEAESPSRWHRWILPMPAPVSGRLRIAGGMVAVLIAMLGGAALVGGASALIGRDLGAPTVPPPNDRPILVAEPTAAATEETDATTTEPLDSAKPPKPPEPNVRDAVEASVAPGVEDTTDEPETSDEVDGTDEPEATDDGDALDDDVDEPEETDEPDDDGSDGDSGAGDGDEPQEPTGS